MLKTRMDPAAWAKGRCDALGDVVITSDYEHHVNYYGLDLVRWEVTKPKDPQSV